MSATGCYSLDLYCDNEAAHKEDYCSAMNVFGVRYSSFDGYDRADAFRNARKAGWLAVCTSKQSRAICPECRSKKKA